MSEWRSIETAPEDKDVLVCVKFMSGNKFITTGMLIDGVWVDWSRESLVTYKSNVIAWMPLPILPKEKP